MSENSTWGLVTRFTVHLCIFVVSYCNNKIKKSVRFVTYWHYYTFFLTLKMSLTYQLRFLIINYLLFNDKGDL